MAENIANIVNFSDWEKIDLRVAKVKNAEDILGADKLYKLTLDVGQFGERFVCAGLKQFYSKEELVGKSLILVSNLAPRMMKGIKSEGMILAAFTDDFKKVILVCPDKEAEPGMRVS
ncbi:Methionine--tRNA ligase [uncultured archaeon]|nr:Methionine--tRNA ligase [uncultured archaeon]